MSKITSITYEQQQRMKQIGEDWHNYASEDLDHDEARRAVADLYAVVGEEAPEVIIADGPRAAVEMAAKRLNIKPDDVERYMGVWWGCWAACYQFADEIGCPLDKEKLDIFTRFCRHVPLIVPYKEFAIVAEKPKIQWEVFAKTDSPILAPENQVDRRRLHCEDGPAVEYRDGFKLWRIHGVEVNEQIVMSPESQTLEEIDNEENEEVKRIRIERYGWNKYLTEKNAECLDMRRNDIENTREALMRCGDMVVLVCACPSTARVYALDGGS